MKTSRTRASAAAAVLGLAIMSSLGGTPRPAAADAAPVSPLDRDGSVSTLAAPSCWAVKQAHPASADGLYWVQTAELVAPKQLYCDMTTDGGGWELIGRGRDGWTWSHNGQGSEASLRNSPSGPAAFAPAAYDTDTVQALLGGGRVDDLPDGIRVRRATDAAGTAYQELRLKPSNRPAWSWAVGGGILLSDVTVDGTSRGGGNSQSWAYQGNQSLLRMTTNEAAAHNYRMGFAYGTGIVGQNTATSYLWQYANEKSALPFAQVFIRPKVLSTSFAPVPAEGLPGSTVRPLLASTTSNTTPWGVTGIEGGVTGELRMEVETFASIGRTMYVGGTFANVQKGATPAPDEKVHQPYLAAFDVDSGAWLPAFRPVLNGEVWDLQATPDGKLIVGGDFSSVNGEAGTSALAGLDPLTGQVLPDWRANLTQVGSSGVTPEVRALDLQDGWIYVGGRFNRVSGGSPMSAPVTVGRATRVRVGDGRPDGTWKPNFDGSIIDLDASERGDRVYVTGYFKNVNFAPSPNLGVISTAAGAATVPGLAAWTPSTGSGSATYQQTIREVGDTVWQGGAEHILSQYDRDSYARKSSNITKNGGDFQALAVVGGVVYASCHCVNWTYSNDINYSSPIASASDVNAIHYIGAWDATTGALLPDFFPSALDTRAGLGPWELTPDVNGCLWFGGDMTKGSWLGTAYQWEALPAGHDGTHPAGRPDGDGHGRRRLARLAGLDGRERRAELRGAARRPRHRDDLRHDLHRPLAPPPRDLLRACRRRRRQPLGDHDRAPGRGAAGHPAPVRRQLEVRVRRRGPGAGLAAGDLRRRRVGDRLGRARVR